MPEHNLSDAEVDQIMERNRRSIRRLTIILAVIDNPALIMVSLRMERRFRSMI
jgi:predicted nucleic acid-binding Zn ribbon protein